MITYNILPGTVDVSVVIRIVDSADGTPETGVVFNTAGIDLEYRREGATSTDITEATLAALTTAHTDGGFLHIGNGYYRLDLPDAACATGVPGVLVHGVVTGMVVIGCYIQLEGHVNATYTRIGAPAGASVSADVAAVKVDTAAILVDTGTTLDARIPAALVSGRMDSSVGAMAANVMTAAAAASDFGAEIMASTPTGNGPFPALGVIDIGTAQAADASSITLRAGFSAAAADMVGVTAWVYSSTNGLHTRGIASAYNNTTKVLTVSGLGTAATGTVLYVLFATPESASGATAAAIADAVWDEAQADHVAAGSFGEVATEVAAILVDTAEIGAAGAGLTNINLPNQTMDIVGNITGNLSGSVGSVTGAVGSVTGAVGSVTGAVGSVTGNVGGNVTGSVGSLAAQAKADVNAEALDVLNTDTFAEPGQGAPASTTTLAAKIGYLFKAWRNRTTQTASEYALYGDDAVTKDQEAAISDDGTTLVKGEVGTGA
jgi:hypothetical protein